MAVRVTEREVRDILDDDSQISVVPFIEQANALTDYVSSKDEDSLLTTALLKRIELNLAAHFYSRRDQLYESKKTGDASAKFQGESGLGLDGSGYGQDAKILDVTGCLRGLDGKGAKAKMAWLGKAPSDQTDYIDRD